MLDSQPLDDFLPFALETLGWVAVIAAVYFVTFYFLGELLLAKMNPWMGTAVFLGLPTVLGTAVFTWSSKFSSSPPGARSPAKRLKLQHLARACALL